MVFIGREGHYEGFSFSRQYAGDRWILLYSNTRQVNLLGLWRPDRACNRSVPALEDLTSKTKEPFTFYLTLAYVCAIKTPAEAFVAVCVAGRRSEARLPQSTKWNRQIGVNSRAFVSVHQWERCA